MKFIPPEILLNILYRLNVKSILSLCLVSKHMRNLSRPLLFRHFDGGNYNHLTGAAPSKRCLERLSIFSEQLQTDPFLAIEVRSLNISCIRQEDISKLQDLLKTLLKHTPNLQHLTAPRSAPFAKPFNNLLEEHNYLNQIRSFEYSAFPWVPSSSLQSWSAIFRLPRLSSLQLSGCEGSVLDLRGGRYLSLRHVDIKGSCLGFTIIARLIQSCQRLESVCYASPTSYIVGDSEPTTIVQALLTHKNSLRSLLFDFCSRAEDNGFDQTPKLRFLEEFPCLERLHIPQDCLPRSPSLPSSLRFLYISCLDYSPEPDLFHNLGVASQAYLRRLTDLYVQTPELMDYRESIFNQFRTRVSISVNEYEQ